MSKPWPHVALGEVAASISRHLIVETGQTYRTIGVKWWGEGAYERQTIDGSQTAAKKLSLVRTDDLIINKIWVRHGSTAVATHDVDGCAASNEFPTFALNQSRIFPRWMHWLSKTRGFWAKCDALSMGTSGKNRIKPERFLTIAIPLPPLAEQRRLVERIDALADKIDEAHIASESIENENQRLLRTTFHDLCKAAYRRPLGEVAPLTRRPATIDPRQEYPGVSVRSFGNGTFHNPPMRGSEITWQKPQLVKSGDILISNIKAWEGAIAVAKPEDDGRYGSHRYLTYVVDSKLCTARFLCFYLLTEEGLYHVGEASPGSADRNRTTSAKGLLKIPVPLPSLERQQWFGQLYDRVEAIRYHHAETAALRHALLPAILDRAVRGEL